VEESVMPIMRSYQCPDCSVIFDYLHMRREDPPPSFCPRCGASTSEVSPEISRFHIATNAGKSGDAVYRALEDSSNYRADMAAQQLGVDPASMSAMRTTDMKDNMREGDTAAVANNNEVSQFMQQHSVGGAQDTGIGAAYAAQTRSGPYAGIGNAMREAVVAQHAGRVAPTIAKGNVGAYKP
jgi:DNA-directed RNA polymerase subunit RPC12/RpoP